jgi:hypothetical protein
VDEWRIEMDSEREHEHERERVDTPPIELLSNDDSNGEYTLYCSLLLHWSTTS